MNMIIGRRSGSIKKKAATQAPATTMTVMQGELCDLCGRRIAPHEHYLVRIDVLADPAMPPISGEALHDADYQAAMQALIEQMKNMSADELQDQVHRHFEFKICRPCQMRFLANPLGKPRQFRPGKN